MLAFLGEILDTVNAEPGVPLCQWGPMSAEDVVFCETEPWPKALLCPGWASGFVARKEGATWSQLIPLPQSFVQMGASYRCGAAQQARLGLVGYRDVHPPGALSPVWASPQHSGESCHGEHPAICFRAALPG